MLARRSLHGLGTAQVSYGHHCRRLVALGHAEQLALFPRVETGHLVNIETKFRSLEGEVSRGLAHIVPGMTVGLPIVREIELGHGKHQHPPMTRPLAVCLRQRLRQARGRRPRAKVYR